MTPWALWAAAGLGMAALAGAVTCFVRCSPTRSVLLLSGGIGLVAVVFSLGGILLNQLGLQNENAVAAHRDNPDWSQLPHRAFEVPFYLAGGMAVVAVLVHLVVTVKRRRQSASQPAGGFGTPQPQAYPMPWETPPSGPTGQTPPVAAGPDQPAGPYTQEPWQAVK